MTAFALLIAALLSFVSYELILYYQRKTTIQAAEFNLRLVSRIIEQDLLNLSSLARTWSTNSTTNALIADYFESEGANAKGAVDAYHSMQDDFRVNRSNNYVRRMIVTDFGEKFLQLDNAVSGSTPLTIHNIGRLNGLAGDEPEQWSRVATDPFSSASVIPLAMPIYGERGTVIGTVHLLAATSVITDKLKGYALPDDSLLLLALGRHRYRIDGDKIVPAAMAAESAAYTAEEPVDPLTELSVVRTADGERRIAVSYPAQDGVVLTQTLSNEQFVPKASIWTSILIGVSLLVIASSGIITLYLTRTISLPVEKLRKRIDKIAQGHFFIDKNIEWNSELGDVGRGINRLSQDILTLMDSRVADAKQKQELEYRMLQSQINPHFLYNTLNSIKWMATIQNATGIAEMTTSLSRLLRCVAKDNRRIVPLRDELSLLDDYFVIQQYRYGAKVSMERNVRDEGLLASLIPRFTLQPLVENAIFHGIEPKGRGRIAVTVERSGDFDVRITVEDDGVGMTGEQIGAIFAGGDPGTKGLFEHVGLRSVNDRLRLAFGDKYGLSVESEAGAYTRMRILIPVRHRE